MFFRDSSAQVSTKPYIPGASSASRKTGFQAHQEALDAYRSGNHPWEYFVPDEKIDQLADLADEVMSHEDVISEPSIARHINSEQAGSVLSIMKGHLIIEISSGSRRSSSTVCCKIPAELARAIRRRRRARQMN